MTNASPGKHAEKTSTSTAKFTRDRFLCACPPPSIPTKAPTSHLMIVLVASMQPMLLVPPKFSTTAVTPSHPLVLRGTYSAFPQGERLVAPK
jgi:hypothetical protein